MGLGGDCFGTGVRVSWSRGEGAPCDAAPERSIAVAGLGLLSATAGVWSPLWLPVPFLLFEPREIHLGSASATVVGATVFWGIGFLIPRAAAAIVGFLFICVYLAHVHSDELIEFQSTLTAAAPPGPVPSPPVDPVPLEAVKVRPPVDPMPAPGGFKVPVAL